MKHLCLALIYLFLASNCLSQENINWDFKNSLVLIEGQYLSSGNFGDVIIYDPTSKKRIKITNDSKYDESPFPFQKDKILFVSKRRVGDRAHGLSKDSDIYISDIYKSNISELFEEKIYLFNSLLATTEKEVYYIKYVDYETGLYLWNSDTKTHNLILSDSDLKDVTEMYISHDNRLLLMESFKMTSSSIFTTLKIYDQLEKEYIDFLGEFEDDELGYLDNESCNAGSFTSEDTFIFSCYSYPEKISKLYQYNISNRSISELAKSNKFVIDNLNSRDENASIYFLGYLFNNSNNINIWKLDRKTLEFSQITFSNLDKDDLRIIK